MNAHCDALLVALLAALHIDRNSLTACHFLAEKETLAADICAELQVLVCLDR